MIMNNKDMPAWDMHHHWVNEKDYIQTLLKEMDRLNIEKTFLIAMGEVTRDIFRKGEYHGFDCDNDDLAKIVKQHGDRLPGYGYLRLGEHKVEDVDRIKEQGFIGIKFHMSLKPYGEEEYFPVYERAQELKLPCLFHTGPIYLGGPRPGYKLRSENYRPIHIEPIGHEFGDLRMIIAHMGVCWTYEATTIARMFPNIYLDISGNPDGYRAGLSTQTFKELFYWPSAHKKIMFGSDLHAYDVEGSLNDQVRIFREIGWSDDHIADVLKHNAETFFEEVL